MLTITLMMAGDAAETCRKSFKKDAMKSVVIALKVALQFMLLKSYVKCNFWRLRNELDRN